MEKRIIWICEVLFDKEIIINRPQIEVKVKLIFISAVIKNLLSKVRCLMAKLKINIRIKIQKLAKTVTIFSCPDALIVVHISSKLYPSKSFPRGFNVFKK